jgi:carbonic anhydrase
MGASSGACTGFQQPHVSPGRNQAPGRRDTGGARTHHHDIKVTQRRDLLACQSMKRLDHLLDKNRRWAAEVTRQQPDFFKKLVSQQAPRYLWIGCADSRVPANEIVDLAPGELFVHRNVANLVIHTDLNCLSVIQYAVDVLKVQDIIVTGHYGCGGIAAALRSQPLGLIDNWLRHVQDIRDRHPDELAKAGKDAVNKLCELNVLEQALNVCRTTVVKDAWDRGQKLAVHGWIYSVADGLIKDLDFCATAETDSTALLVSAIAALPEMGGD